MEAGAAHDGLSLSCSSSSRLVEANCALLCCKQGSTGAGYSAQWDPPATISTMCLLPIQLQICTVGYDPALPQVMAHWALRASLPVHRVMLYDGGKLHLLRSFE
jgi:hypothetical protein